MWKLTWWNQRKCGHCFFGELIVQYNEQRFKCEFYVIIMLYTQCMYTAQDSGQYRVEWLSTILQISKTTQGCWSGIFWGAQFPKIDNFGNARILFSKSHKALNLFLKICKKPSLYFKIQSPKIIFEIECWKEFFLQQLAKWLMI